MFNLSEAEKGKLLKIPTFTPNTGLFQLINQHWLTKEDLKVLWQGDGNESLTQFRQPRQTGQSQSQSVCVETMAPQAFRCFPFTFSSPEFWAWTLYFILLSHSSSLISPLAVHAPAVCGNQFSSISSTRKYFHKEFHQTMVFKINGVSANIYIFSKKGTTEECQPWEKMFLSNEFLKNASHRSVL